MEDMRWGDLATSGEVSVGGQNRRISKHSAAGTVREKISGGMSWQLRVKLIRMARMQGFQNILRREGWEGGSQVGNIGGLG